MGEVHCPFGDRITRVETIVPEVKEDIAELKRDLRAVNDKMDSFIRGLDAKADRADVEDLQKRVWVWSGGLAVLSFLAGLFGKDVIKR